jgi:hypothetical protein
MKKVLTVLLVLGFSTASTATLSDVLWTEDFQGYSLGPIVPQDATWSMTTSAAGLEICEVSNENPPWDGADAQGLVVGMTNAPAGGHGTTATKDLTADPNYTVPVSPVVMVEFDLRCPGQFNADDRWASQDSGFYVRDAAGNNIASLFCRSLYGDYTLCGQEMIPGSEENPWLNVMYNYAFIICFNDDTVILTRDGVGLAKAPLHGDFSPGDIAQIAVYGGLYYKTGGTCRTAADNIIISEVPEPATLTLLALGALAFIRRR